MYTQKYINISNSNKSNNKTLYKRRKTNSTNLWQRIYSMQTEINIILGLKSTMKRRRTCALCLCIPLSVSELRGEALNEVLNHKLYSTGGHLRPISATSYYYVYIYACPFIY